MKNQFVSLLSATTAVVLATFSAAPVLAGEEQQGNMEQMQQMSKPAGMISASTTRTATVTNIDKADRWITLKLADGSLVDIQAGPAVKNFAQIQVGDQVTVSQEATMAMEVVPAGQAPPNVSSGSAVVTAPPGAKPMAVMVDKTMVSGKVTAIDYTSRSVTLQGPQGKSHTIQVSPSVQRLNAVKMGDDVVMTLNTATTIDVSAPAKGATKPKAGY